jgi:integrase/recombinase XerD
MLIGSPLIWSGRASERGFSASGLGDKLRRLCRSAEVCKPDGQLPRIHDYRHSFATCALLRRYYAGVDVQARLPALATYMGHASISSTEYYLSFIPELTPAASNRFQNHYGALVQPLS